VGSERLGDFFCAGASTDIGKDGARGGVAFIDADKSGGEGVRLRRR
jgi:hypothetical protein